MTIDREQLRAALGAFVVAFNADAPDMALRSLARVLAPLVTQIVTDADDETAEEVRAMLREIFKPEESTNE